MARKAAKKADLETSVSVAAPPIVSRSKALIFISHDSRDSDLAGAFAELLADVSVGTLKSFRSSDNLGTTGIPFGDEWYAAIVAKLAEATDVVALLTETSIDRPWILYEAGIATGKLGTRVIGVALGVPLNKAVTGPFGQFQNSADDENSLTKLMMQLLQRNPDASPREETVKIQVRAFREKIGNIFQSKGVSTQDIEKAPSEEENVAKLVEEMKGIIRELPERVIDRTSSLLRRGNSRTLRRLDPRALEAFAFDAPYGKAKLGPAINWMMVISLLKDEMPWLYEPGMEFYRALKSKKLPAISASASQMHNVIEISEHSPFSLLIEEDDKIHFIAHRLHEMIERLVNQYR